MLENWENEICDRFSPVLRPRYYRYYGSGKRIRPDALAKFDIVLTTCERAPRASFAYACNQAFPASQAHLLPLPRCILSQLFAVTLRPLATALSRRSRYGSLLSTATPLRGFQTDYEAYEHLRAQRHCMFLVAWRRCVSEIPIRARQCLPPQRRRRTEQGLPPGLPRRGGSFCSSSDHHVIIGRVFVRHRVILDEAHYIKNHNSECARACRCGRGGLE